MLFDFINSARGKPFIISVVVADIGKIVKFNINLKKFDRLWEINA